MIGESVQNWQTVATHPHLGADEIHLCQFSLQTSEAQIDSLRSLLSPEEISRANRLIRPEDGLRFIVGRAKLRQLLGSYLSITAQSLELSSLAHGKPVLAEPRLSFNLSHSGDLALLAIAHCAPLGVDLELLRPELDWLPLARRYFSASEQGALQALAPIQQRNGFFTVWTRKEAWLKAIGSGFHLPFDTFDVSVPPAAAALLRHQGNPTAPLDWCLEDIPIAANYRATLAYPAPQRKVLLLDFHPSR